MTQIETELLFNTPEDKWRVFQSPKLVMISENRNIIKKWDNTQPLYFYPFSWLDYLNEDGIKELYVTDSSMSAIEKGLKLLKHTGKVHFETLNINAIKEIKRKGHKVSVICDSEDLTSAQYSILPEIDFLKIRIDKNCNLKRLSDIPNEKLLSCIKAYVGEDINYCDMAIQAKDAGFNLFHVAKRLVKDNNPNLSEVEKENILNLKRLESECFKVIIPSSLDRIYAEKFKIDSLFGNSRDCLFSKYRIVLHKEKFYPCCTKRILDQDIFGKEDVLKPCERRECDDCACIYENDMISDIEKEIKTIKNYKFALEYNKGFD